MNKLAQEQIINLAVKTGNTQSNPRLSDLRTAFFGGRGSVNNEIAYLMDQNNSTNISLHDNWEQYERSKSTTDFNPLTQGRKVFFLTQTLD